MQSEGWDDLNGIVPLKFGEVSSYDKRGQSVTKHCPKPIWRHKYCSKVLDRGETVDERQMLSRTIHRWLVQGKRSEGQGDNCGMVLLASRVVHTQMYEQIMKCSEGHVLVNPSFVSTLKNNLVQDKKGVDQPWVHNPFRVSVNLWKLFPFISYALLGAIDLKCGCVDISMFKLHMGFFK